MTDFLPTVIEAPPPPPPPTVVMSEEEEDDEPTGFREEVDTKNIFTTPIVQPITEEDKPEDEEVVEEEVIEEVIEEEPVKPKRNKKQASKKQLEALAKSREKLKAKRIQQKKEKELIQAEAKRLVKERKAQEKTVKFTEKPDPPLPRQNAVDIDIEGAISKALEKYDTARKLRKEEKKKRMKEEEDKKKLQQTVQNAVMGGYKGEQDVWGDCFNFR